MGHATTVPAGIWAAQSSVTIRVDGTSPRGRGQEDVEESEQEGQGQAVERECKTKENDASVTRLPSNDENSKKNPISDEEQLIGRRLCIEEERREWKRQVLRMTLPRCRRRCEVAARTCRFR